MQNQPVSLVPAVKDPSEIVESVPSGQSPALVARMRTCHILSRPLSTATATMQFIKAEIDAGLHPWVVSPAGPKSFLDDCPEVTIIHLEAIPITEFAPAQSWLFVKQILEVLRGQTFDVVVVYTFRGCSLLPLLGRNICNTWLLNIRNSNLRSFGMRAKVADYMTRLETYAFKAVIVCGTEIGHRLLGRRKFHVLPNGADLQKFANGQRDETRRRLGFAESDRVIVYIGVLAIRRRPIRILETFAKVVQAHPEARLLMVGESDKMDELVAWAHEHQLADRITFTGRVPYEVVQDYVAAADIGFAYYPSLTTYEGNIPLKTSELLAAGLPTLATNTAGNRYYIRHEENGLLADDDPDRLAEAMLRLFDDPGLTARLRQHAHTSVMEHDWGSLVRSRLFPLYVQYRAADR